MNSEERIKFIRNELKAIDEDFDPLVSQLMLLRGFLKDLIKVSEGKEPSYQLSEYKKNC